MGMVAFFPVFNEPSFIKCILMIVHQHHYAIVHEHSYWVVHEQQKNPLHQRNCWWSGFFCRSWTCFLWPSLNKIVGQEPLLLVHERLYGIVPELAFISRCWTPPNSLPDYLEWLGVAQGYFGLLFSNTSHLVSIVHSNFPLTSHCF